MRTLEKYASGVDSLHSLACFWACEVGLLRRYPKSQITSFMFQDLHYKIYNGVPTMITKVIRHPLSKYVPNNEKDIFSSKSLRIESIDKMAAHQGVDFSESHSRSGHSLGTNQERN